MPLVHTAFLSAAAGTTVFVAVLLVVQRLEHAAVGQRRKRFHRLAWASLWSASLCATVLEGSIVALVMGARV